MTPTGRFFVVLLGAVLAPAATFAMDPRIPLLAGEPRAGEKVEGFERACARDPALLASLEATADVPARERIHQTLLTVPPYAEAVAEYDARGDNVETWRALLDSTPERDLYLRAHASYFLGRTLLARDELKEAAAVFESVRGRLRMGTPWTDEATFYLAYVYARLPELGETQSAASRSRARELLRGLLPNGEHAALYPEPPERLVEGARWLLRELRGEGTGPLLELAKRMETIERLVRRTQTGAGIQQRQKQVVVVIDRLIELMREKEKGGGG
jgi:hypothetical protein